MKNLMLKNAHKLERLITNNSPIVLTAIGVVGIFGTAWTMHRATTSANTKISSEIYERNLHRISPDAFTKDDLSRKELLSLVWKDYAPVVAVVSISVAAVVGAQYINTKRAAALAAGYMVLEAKHEEYRDKVEELMGKKKAGEVDEAVAKSLVHQNGDASIVVHAGDVLCMDTITGQPFSSNLESLRKAENEINRDILHGDTPSVTDFYKKIGGGLHETRITDSLGWNDENMCELKPTSTLDEEGNVWLVLDFSVLPVHKHWKVGK